MSTITLEQQTAIADKLANMQLPSGLGDAESACSIAAINLALTGKLTGAIPECMSAVIGRWIMQVQDAMPDAMRNSEQWKSLLPLAAGTGREHEQERLEIVLNWMWGRVLPILQPLADKHGFGSEWQHMCTERTVESARTAADAAYASDAAAASWYAADATAYASDAAAATWYAADAAADAASAAAWDAAAGCAGGFDAATYAAAVETAAHAAWEAMDPCGVLELLISKGK